MVIVRKREILNVYESDRAVRCEDDVMRMDVLREIPGYLSFQNASVRVHSGNVDY